MPEGAGASLSSGVGGSESSLVFEPPLDGTCLDGGPCGPCAESNDVGITFPEVGG
jgi:hypothetical protein